LATIALCLLSIGISEATVERSFSIQKLTHNDIRNRLAADIVQAEMRIRFNKSVANDLFNNLEMNNYNDKMEFNSTEDQTQIEDVELSDDDVDANENEEKNEEA
jgi:hypothetical protein